MVYTLTPPMMDLVILSIVSKQDSYGYQISQQLKPVSTLSDSALYPILRRLSDNHYVETYDLPFQGRNRKYYRITDQGKQQGLLLEEEWQLFVDTVNTILKGEHPAGGNDE